jgi:hypothetical protein
VTLFQNPNTQVYFTRKQRDYTKLKTVKKMVNLINYRIKNPNMFYVAPLTFEFEEIKTSEGKETFSLGLYMPYPEEDLRKDLKRRLSHKRGFTN